MNDILITEANRDKKKHIILLGLSAALVIWSIIGVTDYFAWTMLALPGIIMILCLMFTYNKFQFTTFTYVIVFLHFIVLIIGAKYTYAVNPLFEWLENYFNWTRNYYDRVGHFMQGFAPFFLVKELVLRKGYMKRSKFFYLIVFYFILGISATWELLEFAATIISKKPASYVLSLQGDQWDTHWDMIMALLGAAFALLLFGRFHDKKMDAVKYKDLNNYHK